MRLSDLLGAPVRDGQGRSLGHVKDVRLVQDGPYVEGFGHQLRVAELVVGRGPMGTRLGIGWLRDRADRIPWESAVLSVDEAGTVEITTV
jgi:sporulation protein YlmC with PRC-barrel domain